MRDALDLFKDVDEMIHDLKIRKLDSSSSLPNLRKKLATPTIQKLKKDEPKKFLFQGS